MNGSETLIENGLMTDQFDWRSQLPLWYVPRMDKVFTSANVLPIAPLDRTLKV